MDFQTKVVKIETMTTDKKKDYTIHLNDQCSIRSKAIITATDQPSSFNFLSTMDGDESYVTSIKDHLPQQPPPQKAVGSSFSRPISWEVG